MKRMADEQFNMNYFMLKYIWNWRI